MRIENEEKNVFNPYGPINSCALTDMTGDGIPELLILYNSDSEHDHQHNPKDTDCLYDYADVRIYTVILGETTATEMLHFLE